MDTRSNPMSGLAKDLPTSEDLNVKKAVQHNNNNNDQSIWILNVGMANGSLLSCRCFFFPTSRLEEEEEEEVARFE
ncbi:hypothetical protein BST61_g7659 [Cercospora zeina]